MALNTEGAGIHVGGLATTEIASKSFPTPQKSPDQIGAFWFSIRRLKSSNHGKLPFFSLVSELVALIFKKIFNRYETFFSKKLDQNPFRQKRQDRASLG
ncbi:hypothetical protein [Pseudomonas fluorescens]|uniref:hypothetical protein n=1 Tax=Pseudomonas fluorescens TaxID=294 RepID=UPI0012499884|nr:hypothetical protein [Pseudomonas fluorescens]